MCVYSFVCSPTIPKPLSIGGDSAPLSHSPPRSVSPDTRELVESIESGFDFEAVNDEKQPTASAVVPTTPLPEKESPKPSTSSTSASKRKSFTNFVKGMFGSPASSSPSVLSTSSTATFTSSVSAANLKIHNQKNDGGSGGGEDLGEYEYEKDDDDEGTVTGTVTSSATSTTDGISVYSQRVQFQILI